MKDLLGQGIRLRDYVIFPFNDTLKRGRVQEIVDKTISILCENDVYNIDVDDCVVFNAIVSINPQLR